MRFSIPQDDVKHFYNRAGFGIPFHDTKGKSISSLQKEWDRDASKVQLLTAVEKPDAGERTGKENTKEALQRSRQDLMKLNLSWLEQLRITSTPLQEKMTLFWHDHFSCRTRIPYMAQQQNNTLRIFGREKFEELLPAVSKDPAMLQFLNNQQNKKGSPNENFAREVMELFTLGRGNYTEQDVREAARSFTGWGFNAQGDFQFRPRQHDEEVKSFRGKTGNFSGEDILHMILEDPKTARFITKKIVRYFVHQEGVAPEIEESLSASFYQSGYDIEKLLGLIFSSDWFYETPFTGNRIKSPVELLVSIQNHTGGKFENTQSLIFFQRALGQLLFFPPNVGGWPKGQGWIDSSSLLLRMSLPQLIFHQQENNYEAKDDGDVNSINEAFHGKRNLTLNVDWESIARSFAGTANETVQLAEAFLLARPTTKANRELILTMASKSTRDVEFVKKVFTGYISLPEYQLC
jgi:uncharacterized protein (DUF1800 family)